MGGVRAALAILVLASPGALALIEIAGSCGGTAPELTLCAFDARLPFLGGLCAPDTCVPGGIARAGGEGEDPFTGILTVRTQRLDQHAGSAHWTCVLLRGEGACEPDWTPQAWPMLGPGPHRAEVRVLAGEGAWWGALAYVQAG